jgi:hypothetical protein
MKAKKITYYFSQQHVELHACQQRVASISDRALEIVSAHSVVAFQVAYDSFYR